MRMGYYYYYYYVLEGPLAALRAFWRRQEELQVKAANTRASERGGVYRRMWTRMAMDGLSVKQGKQGEQDKQGEQGKQDRRSKQQGEQGEEAEVSATAKKVPLRRIVQEVLQTTAWRFTIPLVILMFVQQYIGFRRLALTADVWDAATAEGASFTRDVVPLLRLKLLIWLSEQCLRLVSKLLNSYSRWGLQASLRQRIVHVILHQPYDFFEQAKAGEVSRRLNKDDSQALVEVLNHGLLQLVQTLSQLLIGIYFVLKTDGLVAVCSVVVRLLPVTYINNWSRNMSVVCSIVTRDAVRTLDATATEVIGNIEVVKTCGAEDHEQRMLSKQYSELKSVREHSMFVNMLTGTCTDGFHEVHEMLLLGLGAWRVVSGHSTVGRFVAFRQYLNRFNNAAQSLTTYYTKLSILQMESVPYFELLEMGTQAQQRAATAGAPARHLPASIADRTSPIPYGDIVFSDVSFTYASRPTEVLHNANFTIPARSCVALVGASGSGKSTICKLLLQLYDPSSGRITIDGVPIQSLDLQAYSRSVAYVSQTPVLFDRTVLENVAYGMHVVRATGDEALMMANPDRGEDVAAPVPTTVVAPSGPCSGGNPEGNAHTPMIVTMEEVVDATKAAMAYEFITTLPDGFDTVLGARGQALSGGQRQRLCLARALLRGANLLILDEPTTHLDAFTERAFQEAVFESGAGNKTTIIVAHKLSTIQACDLIFAVQDGRIAECGDHTTLLREHPEGVYASLLRAASEGENG